MQGQGHSTQTSRTEQVQEQQPLPARSPQIPDKSIGQGWGRAGNSSQQGQVNTDVVQGRHRHTKDGKSLSLNAASEHLLLVKVLVGILGQFLMYIMKLGKVFFFKKYSKKTSQENMP